MTAFIVILVVLLMILVVSVAALLLDEGTFGFAGWKRVKLPPDPPREELTARAIGNLLHGLQYALEDEDFVRAQDAFDAIDRSFLREDEIAMMEAGLAWCEFNLGHVDKARDLAKDAVHDAPANMGRARGCALAILGAIEVRAGQPSSAVEALREAVGIDPRPEYKAFAGFFLGEALLATDSIDEARAAWEAASRCADSRYALLARERMAAVEMASPYR